jgi:hypothetical protein
MIHQPRAFFRKTFHAVIDDDGVRTERLCDGILAIEDDLFMPWMSDIEAEGRILCLIKLVVPATSEAVLPLTGKLMFPPVIIPFEVIDDRSCNSRSNA